MSKWTKGEIESLRRLAANPAIRPDLEFIALRLGKPQSEVQAYLDMLDNEGQESDAQQAYHFLQNVFTGACHHYNTIGESMKVLAHILSSRASFADVMLEAKKLGIDESVAEQLCTHLCDNFVILHPSKRNMIWDEVLSSSENPAASNGTSINGKN